MAWLRKQSSERLLAAEHLERINRLVEKSRLCTCKCVPAYVCVLGRGTRARGEQVEKEVDTRGGPCSKVHILQTCDIKRERERERASFSVWWCHL